MKKEKEENKKRLENLAFEEWREKTPDEEIKELVPPGGWTPLGDMHLKVVKDYFEQNEMDNFLKGLH